MRLALARSDAKLRFGLLIGAVALLVFLILFQQTLASGLLGSFTDGLNQSADVLVFNADARGTSRPGGHAEWWSKSGPCRRWASGTARRVHLHGRRGGRRLTDTTIFGYVLDGPGGPTTLVEGRLPESDGGGRGERRRRVEGDIGDTVHRPVMVQIRVVGLASDAQFNVQPPSATYATWERLSRSVNPDARRCCRRSWPHPAPGADPEAAVAAIDGSVEGVEAVATQTAVDNLPGVESISQSFAVILLLVFIVVGSSRGCSSYPCRRRGQHLLRGRGQQPHLLANIALQVTIVTVAGVAIASFLLVPTQGGAVASRSRRAPPDPHHRRVDPRAGLIFGRRCAAWRSIRSGRRNAKRGASRRPPGRS